MAALNTQFEKVTAKQADGSEQLLPPAQGLQLVGPIIPATLHMLDAHRTKAEASPPAPVAGNVLIDTGASTTCLDAGAAQRAGLPIVGNGKMNSATHDNHAVPLFAGMLRLTNFGDLPVENAMGANLGNQGIIALLGRDVLRNCILVYNGIGGSVTLAR